jgi:hypothetical protein
MTQDNEEQTTFTPVQRTDKADKSELAIDTKSQR